MKKFNVNIENETYMYEESTSYFDIVTEHKRKALLVKVNGKLQELHKTLKNDVNLEFVTLSDAIGRSTYERSAILILLKAIDDIYGSSISPRVEFSTGNGLFVRLGSKTDYDVEKINNHMRELVDENIRIEKTNVHTDLAIKMFHDAGFFEKEKLFRFRRVSRVNIYRLENYIDYYYGYMVYSTGYIDKFSLTRYKDGIVLVIPKKENPETAEEFVPEEKIFNELNNASINAIEMGVSDVGSLNEMIANGMTNEMILISEAYMEKKIGDIADDIIKRGNVKLVMIAGPSSSGKTTFSHRLSVQLMAHGLKPHPLEVDNYFKNREDTPRDENGELDFENLDAMDIEQFNADMLALLDGERVELPNFNFKTGQREYNGNFLKLGKDDILVIEGIHCLNDKLSYRLPNDSRYKIYISALTQLNIDEHNRIPTTDGRLLRRMIRDVRKRGISPTKTLAMWDSVRRGEERNIFPYQSSADATFNSALNYEISVLKQYVEPILFSVQKDSKEYPEAKRLLKFLDYFLGVPSDNVPSNSILREFIGGSAFHV